MSAMDGYWLAMETQSRHRTISMLLHSQRKQRRRLWGTGLRRVDLRTRMAGFTIFTHAASLGAAESFIALTVMQDQDQKQN
jgi:hypothetical protein